MELALVVNNLQSNQSSAAQPAAAASEPKTEMQTILAAITNLSCPTPSVVTKPKPETVGQINMRIKKGIKNSEWLLLQGE